MAKLHTHIAFLVLVLSAYLLTATASSRGVLQHRRRQHRTGANSTGVAHPRVRQQCTSTVNYEQIPRGRPAAAVELNGDQFVTVGDGEVVELHGVNWFGFNNRMTFLNGLWAGQASANSDFAAIIWQMKLLGFNAVRLPFLFEDLQAPAAAISGYCTHESTLAELANRTVDPQYTAAVRRAPPTPAVPLPRVAEPGSCNKYIPPASGGKTMDRFLWTVQWLVANGMYVLIDYHPMGMEKTSFDADAFVAAWKQVWESVSCLPNYKRDLVGRVFIDILNEPDSQWQRWQPKDGKAGMTQLYLGVMDALWEMTPGDPIFFINGGGQGDYAGLNWGNGFVTDQEIIKQFQLSDANPFFQTLMGKPYLQQVVISPHIYGPSVSHRKDWYKGDDWMVSLDKAFGYLSKDGFCYQGKCHVFPVAVGEFGSRFQDPEDLAHLADLAAYMNAKGTGNTGGHTPVKSYFYWCYNANSGDTGGLVDDSWMNLEWVKLRYLMDNLGLTPWYKAGGANRRRTAPRTPAAANTTAAAPATSDASTPAVPAADAGATTLVPAADATTLVPAADADAATLVPAADADAATLVPAADADAATLVPAADATSGIPIAPAASI